MTSSSVACGLRPRRPPMGGLIQQLLDDADRRGQHLVLDVFANNTRAKALYQRLGFRVVGHHPEKDYAIRMRSGRAHDPGLC